MDKADEKADDNHELVEAAEHGEMEGLVESPDLNSGASVSHDLEGASVNAGSSKENGTSKEESAEKIPSLSNLEIFFAQGYKEKRPMNEMLLALVNNLQDDTDEYSVIWNLASCISYKIGVDAFRVYKLYPGRPSCTECFCTNTVAELLKPTHLERADTRQTIMVREAARMAVPWRVTRFDHPTTFPQTPHALFKLFGVDTKINALHILYQPIMTTTGMTAYVVEMWRIDSPFSEKDEAMSNNFLIWGSLALQYCSLNLDKERELNMPDFILDIVKAIFEGIMSLEELVKRILQFAQRLVNADRGYLYLVDHINFELVFITSGLRYENDDDGNLYTNEYQIPINRGIPGHVAMSGEMINVSDAYSDLRFDRAMDEVTGYRTVSVLCVPIRVGGRLLSIFQMVNKRTQDGFNREDEMACDLFSTFFGLAFGYAEFYEQIARKEHKYRVALEVLGHHNMCREDEVQALLCDRRQPSVNIIDYFLDPYYLTEFEKCRAVIAMFVDLFGIKKFDLRTIARFILTVKKNYRRIPYHNFDHGWCVAQAMYVFLQDKCAKWFGYNTRLAMFVASLCHDLDHRGYTNRYTSETGSPLASMYATSILEHHHFDITVSILQQDGHNIFSRFSSAHYKEILGTIKQCILATDQDTVFTNLQTFKNVNPNHPRNRELVMAITIAAAEMSAFAKPWDVQLKTVQLSFDEFYNQGDEEKAARRTPNVTMDRERPDQQPASMVKFLHTFCVPCYRALCTVLPSIKPMYIMATRNENRWTFRAWYVDRIGQPIVVRDDAHGHNGQENSENVNNEPTANAAAGVKDAENNDQALEEGNVANEKKDDANNSIQGAGRRVNNMYIVWEIPE